MNRWIIDVPKKKISSTNFSEHIDDIEMSGEKVSGLIKYGVKENKLVLNRHVVFPMFRIQPDVTQSSFQLDINDKIFDFEEEFIKVEIDGILHIHTKTNDFNIIHHFYPSTIYPIFYELIDVINISGECKKIDYESDKKILTTLGCEGYIRVDRTCDKKIIELKKNESISLTFAYQARFVNEELIKENNSFNKRMDRVNELLSECDFTSGNDLIDTMFAFAKIRAGESIFNTRKGKIHSPGGTNYYAAIWCNDQCEYSTPWFGYTGDKILNEAALNAIKWFSPYMSEELLPIPSSIISEGTDYWNGAKDRGDASMFLFGTSRFILESGIKLSDELDKELKWAFRYVKSKINEDNVVVSDTDELENRLSSGINLNTSSLSYGGFRYYKELLFRENRLDEAKEIEPLIEKIKDGIENYFGGNIKGYETYHYHKGLDVIRSWNSLPLYMGIQDRKDGTIKSIIDNLWKDGSALSTEGENIMWDRSAIYFIASMFRCDYSELAYSKLKEMSEKRLLGDRVPYAVEAYPECNMRHLSGESALFSRIITDGLIGIDFDGGLKITPHVPNEIKEFSMKNIMLCGNKVNIFYKDGNVRIENI